MFLGRRTVRGWHAGPNPDVVHIKGKVPAGTARLAPTACAARPAAGYPPFRVLPASRSAACAAANRATGTRGGEQLT